MMITMMNCFIFTFYLRPILYRTTSVGKKYVSREVAYLLTTYLTGRMSDDVCLNEYRIAHTLREQGEGSAC